MTHKTLIQIIAGELQRMQWANASPDTLDHARWNLQALNDLLPSGAGIDSGTHVLIDDSNPNKIKFSMDYHHMNQNGFYDGWTQHTVTVTASFVFGMDIKISGPNRNEIKDYLHESLQATLSSPVIEEFDSVKELMTYKFA